MSPGYPGNAGKPLQASHRATPDKGKVKGKGKDKDKVQVKVKDISLNLKQLFWPAFFILCALLELVLAYLFPVNTLYTGYSATFHLFLLALLCFVLYKGTIDRLLYGLLFGLLYDFFIGFCFPYCTLFFTGAAYTAGVISLMRRPVKIIAILLICLVYDLLPTLFYMSQGILTNTIGQFLLYIELPAFAINLGTLWLINSIYVKKSERDASFAYISLFKTVELV